MNGDRVIGGYTLRRLLGRGGMGEVHLAATPTGGLAAVKLIHPGLASDPAFLRRFEREVAAARRVARFCTAPVLDAGIDGGVAYLVTEYVKGPDLARAVREQGPLSGGNLEALAVGVATALSAIHGAGVIHRDLKPANVLLSPLGPRVIDFGIARLVGNDALSSQAILGTPAFMAPEQVRGEALTPAADVFAWGGVIAFAGTGRLPFGGESPEAALWRITHAQPRLEGLDEGIRAIVERALAKDPAQRPTAQQLLAELVGGTRLATATEVVERTWTGTGERPVSRRRRRRRRWPWVVAGSGALVLALAAAALPGLTARTWPYEAGFADGWAVGASGGGEARLDGTGYELTVEPGWRLWKSAPVREPESGVIVSAQASLEEGEGEYGVWCHGSASSGDRYEFGVSSAGRVSIVKRRMGTAGRVLYGPADVPGQAAAGRVVVECGQRGSEVRLRMWLNESLVAEVSDAEAPYGAGEAGVHAASGATRQARVRFESFAARPVTGT
ncbi:serine/threonine-protein kinase [Nonomuraea gerenzanensis]|uniref:Putative serine/threonine protein kinase n=1 Tax=Nonomuraea gerenzanensis TaxID=93944 RepID=A0A1M4E117_9ACTN|nr:serine/threonine-protein kinase [Nonomuraea gerenzanensis]UBU14786.1 serine/threonine protein kinase [Nonomuraea gerenzanensis]SBO92513.1 putative serine/threonine protein kinase [Nonomuraea gerenzanensis]